MASPSESSPDLSPEILQESDSSDPTWEPDPNPEPFSSELVSSELEED